MLHLVKVALVVAMGCLFVENVVAECDHHCSEEGTQAEMVVTLGFARAYPMINCPGTAPEVCTLSVTLCANANQTAEPEGCHKFAADAPITAGDPLSYTFTNAFIADIFEKRSLPEVFVLKVSMETTDSTNGADSVSLDNFNWAANDIEPRILYFYPITPQTKMQIQVTTTARCVPVCDGTMMTFDGCRNYMHRMLNNCLW